jgi:nickel transport protein
MLLLACAVLLVGLAPASAHRLKAFATVEDGAISGYGFFVGGGRARGAAVTVRDGSGRELYRGETDADGRFMWRPPAAADYIVIIDTREGHVAEARVSASRFGRAFAQAGEAFAVGGATNASARAGTGGAEAEAPELERRLEAAVARQVRPLLERIEAMDARLRMSDVVAGLCAIVGLAGIALWATGRRGSRAGGAVAEGDAGQEKERA